MGSMEEVCAAGAKHGTPLWCGWLNAYAKKTQTRSEEDGRAHAQACLNGDGDHDIWQDMPKQDGPISSTYCPSCFYISLLSYRKGAAPHQANVNGHHANANRDDRILQSHSQDGHQGQGQKKSGECKQRVRDSLDTEIDFAAVVTRNKSEWYADEQSDKDHSDSNQQRNP